MVCGQSVKRETANFDGILGVRLMCVSCVCVCVTLVVSALLFELGCGVFYDTKINTAAA